MTTGVGKTQYTLEFSALENWGKENIIIYMKPLGENVQNGVTSTFRNLRKYQGHHHKMATVKSVVSHKMAAMRITASHKAQEAESKAKAGSEPRMCNHMFDLHTTQ